jgi:hypothetical protein
LREFWRASALPDICLVFEYLGRLPLQIGSYIPGVATRHSRGDVLSNTGLLNRGCSIRSRRDWVRRKSDPEEIGRASCRERV